MTDPATVAGHCLCGAVRIRAAPRTRHLDACHCDMCRRWGGGPLIVVQCDDTLDLEGGEFVTTYASSEWAERAFCSRCGSHLFYRLKGGGILAIPAGLLDLEGDWLLTQEIFVDEQPAYYALAGNAERLTGEEVIARYGTP